MFQLMTKADVIGQLEIQCISHET